MPNGDWRTEWAAPGRFIIDFGEMLEYWTARELKATEHNVQGNSEERISVPLFLKLSYDTYGAPSASGTIFHAGEPLTRPFNETYVHLKVAS